MKNKRMYGLFEVEKNGEKKKYSRLYPTLSFPKETAVRVFQDALLAYYFGSVDKPRELRPVKY